MSWVAEETDTLTALAETAQQRRLEMESATDPAALKGLCRLNAQEMADVLEAKGYQPDVVRGLLTRDPALSLTSLARPALAQREAHGLDRVPVPPVETFVEPHTLAADAVGTVGIEHWWVEVAFAGTRWIVEPYSEIRGDVEYTAIATTVKPADYYYLADSLTTGTPTADRWDDDLL